MNISRIYQYKIYAQIFKSQNDVTTVKKIT